MGQKVIRLLHADEIECRVGYISEKGLSLLLYKDARVDMKILDEVYGASNWQRKHEVIGGNLYCTVSVWDEEKKQWISKMDVGTKSNTEKEKGEASDSFKRACFSHGIGRELYTAPFIWVSASKTHIQMKENRYVTTDKFTVASISYSPGREITGLTIINQDGQVVYHLTDEAVARQKPTAQPEASGKDVSVRDTVKTGHQAEAINRELARTGVALDTVLQRYGIASLNDMDEGTYRKAMNSLRRTKTRVA
ncbi:MAG: hypothetical protein LUF00_02025 [Lachnospiraceae bacterium]|nr:hypothetical protein [Lachnospiraceae bacterium]